MTRRIPTGACIRRMSEARSRRLLVVANLTESAPRLLEEVERRARGGCEVTLMVPPDRHPDASDWTEQEARNLVQRAAGDGPVVLIDCGPDAAATIGAFVEQGGCDEILLCRRCCG
jgi:hypothetical protein